MHKQLLSLATLSSLALYAGSFAHAQNYTQVNLVANTSGVAPVTDPNLVNPWGLSRAAGSPWWVSDNGSGLSTLYNGSGTIEPLVVTIPPNGAVNPVPKTGSPTGTIYNGSKTDFLLAPNTASVFLFSSLDGTISGWDGGAASTTVVKTTNGSVYTGLTSATINGNRYLYAANFAKGTVDVYNNAFQWTTLPTVPDGEPNGNLVPAFTDVHLQANYVPFNVQAIGNDIVVTWVLHEPGQGFPTAGPSRGYVDIFSSSGVLEIRLQRGAWLNVPWGVALAPLDFGAYSHDLLVGQFASGGTTANSGTIAAYDLATGRFVGQVLDATGTPISINGLWALSPGNSATPASYDAAGAPGSELYFSAGPDHGTGGLLGYITPLSTELVTGNDN
jgi:uncharacterized protein (TIGR03118 family)